MRAVIILLGLGALLTACSEDEATVVSTPTSVTEDGATAQPTEVTDTGAPEVTSTEAPEPDALNLEVGATADIADARVTLHTWRVDPGQEFFKPAADKQWIVVDVTVENTGDDEYNISSLLQTAIRDSEDREHSDLALADTSGSLDGTIPTGQSLRGERAFEIPAASTGLQFVFKQAFGNEQARWNLR